MPQNLVSVVIDDALRAQLDATAGALDELLAGKTRALTPDERRSGTWMGDKSEAFTRNAIGLVAQNRQVVPPTLDIDEALRDLAALEAIRPLLARLTQLTERLRDTEMALGSDLFSFAIEAYALLKVVGRQQGLDSQVRELGERFRANGRRRTPTPEAA